MTQESESPRFVLILGGLFLIAYAAYQVGSAWMAIGKFNTGLMLAHVPLLVSRAVGRVSVTVVSSRNEIRGKGHTVFIKLTPAHKGSGAVKFWLVLLPVYS